MSDKQHIQPDENDYKLAINYMHTFIDATVTDLQKIEKRAEAYAKILVNKMYPFIKSCRLQSR